MTQTIALVDDDRNILTSVSMTLEQEGFQVRTYTDGESALQGLLSRPADLAVLDIKMPRMDGMELLQRLRGARWYVALAAWVLLVGSITLLTWWSMSGVDFAPGGTIFDVVLFFVLGFGMLIMPALTATSVNGDREHGVLATLQTTLLSPADIVLGKLLASFTISMAFLASAAPFLLVMIGLCVSLYRDLQRDPLITGGRRKRTLRRVE